MSAAYLIITIFFSLLALNAADEEPVTNLEDIVGRYKMTDFGRSTILKNKIQVFAEFIGTKPEHIKQILEHPTVGNYEVKLIDKDSQEFELTMETLTGKVTGRMKPGSNGEMAWLDGRKFSIVNMTRFKNEDYDDDYKCVYMTSEIGGYSFSTSLEMGTNGDYMWDLTDWKNHKSMYFYFDREY